MVERKGNEKRKMLLVFSIGYDYSHLQAEGGGNQMRKPGEGRERRNRKQRGSVGKRKYGRKETPQEEIPTDEMKTVK